jgi:hypothetical protein
LTPFVPVSLDLFAAVLPSRAGEFVEPIALFAIVHNTVIPEPGSDEFLRFCEPFWLLFDPPIGHETVCEVPHAPRASPDPHAERFVSSALRLRV